MNIKSAEFVKGITDDNEILDDGIPQVAFIGRSNVGKSSVINSLVGRRDLAKSSAHAGRTKQVNFFLINRDFYLVDLPGYGFAHASLDERKNLRKLIFWYLMHSGVDQKKVVLIIDAKIGPTEDDMEMLRRLEDNGKDILIVANKIDKLKASESHKQLKKIQEQIGSHAIIHYSAEKKIGVQELTDAMLK